MKTNKKPFFPLLIVCVTTCALMAGVWFLLASTVDKVVQEEAKHEAIHWMEHFVAHLNN